MVQQILKHVASSNTTMNCCSALKYFFILTQPIDDKIFWLILVTGLIYWIYFTTISY
ncbi:hypothetical protein BCR42DRAFT_420103 [Absidia repens]|uniref:Uncharacterized protein n=1 Tax=Absidia repens TaxID=90262 RepID=A0A1X2IAT1_9FUNG|nr:hypothetical protein BCR42DRAFT_420103 [Absidia repens]